MDILIGILTVVEVLVCLLLILIVLMQRPRQEGLGASFGDGMMSQIAGAQTTNVLQKFTVYLAVALFVLTITLAVLTSRQQSLKSGTKLFDAPPVPVPAEVEAPKVETAPVEAPKTDAPAAATDKPADAPAPAAEKPAEAPKAATPAPAMKEPEDAPAAPAAPAPEKPAAGAPKAPAPANP
jgi:preprotein translocase subunit SecG